LNKFAQKVKLIKGDIRKIKLGRFDRIISAMPYEGAKLVGPLLKCAKRGAWLHVLDFAPEENLAEAGQRLVAACGLRKCKILRIKKAGQHAVRKYRVCVDAKVL